MTGFVTTLADAVAPWSTLYGDSTLVKSLVMFAHLAGLVLAGGTAIAADRMTLRAARPDGASWRPHALSAVAAAHRPVLVGLAFALGSGVLLLAADVETFLLSPVLWLKLGLIALLLANGRQLARAEYAAGSCVPADDQPARWRGLRVAAGRSLALWFALVLVSVVMVNAPALD